MRIGQGNGNHQVGSNNFQIAFPSGCFVNPIAKEVILVIIKITIRYFASTEAMDTEDVDRVYNALTKELPKDEELDNFNARVDEVANIIRDLTSDDPILAEKASMKANFLLRDNSENFDEDNAQYKIKSERSIVNKIKTGGGDGDMEPDAFMKMVEKDANDRAQDKRRRKEKSDMLRKKGNEAFSKKNFAGALANYNQAIALIKDSPCLYNNRAVTYINIGIYSKAIEDCDTALELAEFSMKARLLKAKALFLQGEADKCKEWLRESETKYPAHSKMIRQFETDLFNMTKTMGGDNKGEDECYDPDKVWRKAAAHQV